MERDIVSRVRRPFFLLVVVKALLFMLLLPPWQGPDEIQHFTGVLMFAGGAPFGSTTPNEAIEARILQSLDRHDFWRLSEDTIPRSVVNRGSTSPVLLWFLAIPVRHLPTRDVISQLMFLRFLSVCCSLGIVWLAFQVAAQFDPESPWTALTAASIVAFHPQYSFISGVFSPDNYFILFLSLIVYLLCRFPYVRNKTPIVVALFLLTGFSFFSKRAGFVAIPVCLLGLLSTILLSPASKERSRILLGFAASVSAGVVVYLLGMFLYSPAAAWGGWILQEAMAVLSAISVEQLTPERLIRSLGVFYVSFWFSYGWMIYKLSYGWYLVLGAMTLLSVGGVVVLIAKRSHRERLDTRVLLVALISVFFVVTLYLSVVLFRPVTAHGRFLFPVIVPLAVLMAVGIRACVPAVYKDSACIVTILFFIALNGLCLLKYLIPIFYL